MLMNTEMVKAILARRKTVTRRLIKPQPKDKLELLAILNILVNGLTGKTAATGFHPAVAAMCCM